MKRLLCMALLALAIPAAAFAHSVDFSNSGGTLTANNGTLTLTGSELIAVNGLNGLGLVVGNLGSLSFTTGSLASGNMQTGATFNPGGSFVITGNGTGGIPNGIIFSGAFTGTTTWTQVQLANGTYTYTLTGTISGTWYNGTSASGVMIAVTFNTDSKNPFNGTIKLGSGDTDIVTSVPEPSTLGLLGTGLVGVGGLLSRRKRA